MRFLVTIILTGFVLTGCMSPKSFVDPSIPKVSYDEIKKPSEPMRLKLFAEFQRNGEHYPKADSTLKDNAERILRATGVIVPVEENAAGEIMITVNNLGDTGSAAAKGIGTGLTFGLIGSTVMDAYEMTMTISTKDKSVTKNAIKHSIYTAFGNTSLPDGVEAVPLNVGFERILEQMIIRGLIDFQNEGIISKKELIFLFHPLIAGLGTRQTTSLHNF